jgi:hypothetical protein
MTPCALAATLAWFVVGLTALGLVVVGWATHRFIRYLENN